ncbi:MAG: hypothetical protein ISP90_16955 [Nevskia sp.]|nr:hypothetical protein [Nevskia sp.]
MKKKFDLPAEALPLLPFGLVRLGAKLVAAALALAVTGAGAQAMPTPLEQQCFNQAQGQVAWNQQGNRNWAPANLRNLCRGTTNPAATIACFQFQIQANASWSQAIGACKAGGAGGAQAAGTTAAGPAGRDAEAAAGINGRTATVVVFGQSGQKLGDYRQIKPNRWAETGADGSVHFRFNEMQRDDWSVYLVDPSRGVRIQLDLYTRQVKYADATSPAQRPLYDVLSASSTPIAGSMAATPEPGVEIAPAHGTQPATAGGSGQIDSSFVVLRSGPVNGAADAAAKCGTICVASQGFSGRWAITNAPNLGVCQCNARPPTGIRPNEVVSQPIQTNDDAGRLCPAACQWYGGGDGSWRRMADGTSLCGCVQQVQP